MMMAKGTNTRFTEPTSLEEFRERQEIERRAASLERLGFPRMAAWLIENYSRETARNIDLCERILPTFDAVGPVTDEQ